MTEEAEIRVRLFCYDPGGDEPPRYEDVVIPRKPEMRILDVLNHIYDSRESDSLAHRWFCGTKKCGECAVMVNGTPVLSCWDAASDEMTLEPLANFPIIRDLVVDTAPYERMLIDLQPFLHRANPPIFPEKVTASSMEGANRLLKCIECNACTAAVPVTEIAETGISWTGYAGPAALVRFAQFVLDPRDELDRRPIAQRAGLKDFPLFESLRDICPQGIDIVGDALVPARKKLFGDAETNPIHGSFSAPLIISGSWSAFVRLTDEKKAFLLDEGRIQSKEFPSVSEAYVTVQA